MADYFTNFSVVVPLPDEAAQAYALNIAEQAAAAQSGEEMPTDFPADLAGVIEEWRFETSPGSSAGNWDLWLHSNSSGIDAACAFIQHLLRKFNPAGFVGFEWSHDCSRPRLDAYGGGAAFITAQKIKTMTTADWLKKHAARRASSIN